MTAFTVRTKESSLGPGSALWKKGGKKKKASESKRAERYPVFPFFPTAEIGPRLVKKEEKKHVQINSKLRPAVIL